MITYKCILQKLSERGWSSYRLKHEKKLSGGTIDRLREGRPISTETINVLCELCNCQPGDLLAWVPDDAKEE